jgi:hypothetical protein
MEVLVAFQIEEEEEDGKKRRTRGKKPKKESQAGSAMWGHESKKAKKKKMPHGISPSRLINFVHLSLFSRFRGAKISSFQAAQFEKEAHAPTHAYTHLLKKGSQSFARLINTHTHTHASREREKEDVSRVFFFCFREDLFLLSRVVGEEEEEDD